MTRNRLKVVVAGAGGKMGQALIEGVLADASLQLAAALDASASPAVGRNVGGIKVSSDVRKAVAAGDVLIDFTRPEGTIAHLEACARAGKSIVIGTTGISEPLRKAILQAARRIPIAMSPNFAVGVNAVFRLAEVAAGILGDGYDVEIVEAHHRHKVDAPSGTALKLGEMVAPSLESDLRRTRRHGREGDTGVRPAKADRIPRHSRRRYRRRAHGDLRRHRRAGGGHGPLAEPHDLCAGRAARRQVSCAASAPGLYDMNDVLGLR